MKIPTTKELSEQIKAKTTIGSPTYDEGFVKLGELKRAAEEAKKKYEDLGGTDERKVVRERLLGTEFATELSTAKTDYEVKQAEYEKYKKAREYSFFPDGEAKTTNPKNKLYNATTDFSIDWEYEYINDINGVRKTVAAGAVNRGNPYKLYDNMSDREIGIYNYLYDKKGKKAAKEFLAFLEEDLEARHSAGSAEQAQKFAEKHPYVSAALSVPANAAAAGEQIKNTAEYLFTGETKRNQMADKANIYRGALAEKVDWEIGNWDAFDFVYNTAMSAADTLVVAPLGTAGAVALGLSAAASTTNDILDRGGTNEQAFWGGIAAGVFEGFFEKFSISQLETMKDGAVKGLRDYAKNVGKSMLTNASEETATEAANLLYDWAVNDGISQYALLVEEYMQDPNMDEKTAKKKAAKKLGLQILEAGASGALMGFGFASASSAKAYNNYKKYGLQDVINRLANDEDVSVDEIYNLPQIRKVSKEVAEREETYAINTPERNALRQDIVSKLSNKGSYSGVDENGKEVYNGNVKQERRADIVIGLSAAGKSSVLVNPLSERYSSRIIDSDMAKEELPEFDNGLGANAVHRESQVIISDVLGQATQNGDNIVWAIVGGNDAQSLISKIEDLKSFGYSVHLHLNELSNNKALGRALNRFLETGRYIPPEVIKAYGDTPTQNFNTIINTEGLVDGYTHYSNDVARGEKPKLIEASENDREFDERLFRGKSVSQEMSRNEGSSENGIEASTETVTDSGENAEQFFEDEEAETELPENIEILSLTKDNDKRRHTTLKEQQYIQKICDKLGIKIVFEDVYQTLIDARYNMHGYIPDGYYDRVTRVLHIGYTVANPIKFVFKHELTHYCEGTESFKRFVEAVRKTRAYKKWLKKQCGFKCKVDLETLEDGYVSLYNYERPSVAQAKVEDISGGDMPGIVTEPVCDFVGDCLFTEKGSGLEALRNDLDIDVKERNVIVQYIRDFFRFVKERLSGHKISLEISRLENRFNRALSEAKFTEPAFGEPMDDIKFANAVAISDSGEKYVNIKPDAIDLNNGSSIAKNIATILSEKFNNLILVNGQYFRVNAKTNSEFTGSDWALALKKEHPDWFNDKIQTLAYADDILKSAKSWINRAPKHPRKDKITSFGHGEILYKVGNNGYSAEVIVGLKDDGSAVLYDIIKINDKKIVDTNSVGKGKSLSSTDVSTEFNISNDAENVNTNSTQESGEYSETAEKSDRLGFSVPTEARMLLNSYESGEITREEYHQKFDELWNKTISEMEDRVLAEKISAAKEGRKIPKQQNPEAMENLARYKRGEISREEYLQNNDRLWGEANKKYGAIEQGEKSQTPMPIAVPKAVAEDMPTERFARTFVETGKLTDEMLEKFEEKVLLGDFSYKAISDDKAMKYAETTVQKGKAEEIWGNVANGTEAINKNNIAIGEQLLAAALEAGDTKRVLELSAELADIFTISGQNVQAARLLKKMTGAGRLVSLQRTVKTLNKDLRNKYGDKAPEIKISPEIAEMLTVAKSKKAIEQAYQALLQDIANQMPVSFLDKWNAWRYFAMLFNPKTHVRNVLSNAIFTPVVRIKDVIATGIEAGVAKAGLIDSSNRTKSLIIKKEYAAFAKADGKSDEVKQLLKGNKYNDKSALKEKQRIFKSKALEFITRFNSNALEAEDMLFKNRHYIHALAGYLQARNADLKVVSKDVLTEARIYAVNEARKATFTDESALANWIQNFGNKNLATNFFVEGILPFKRTPINIVKRGVEYSPIGLSKTLVKGTLDVKRGKITPTEFIDGLASGLTGTGIMLAGVFLTLAGCISGGEDDDKESTFEKLLGKQEYAVEFFGRSYTIDWAAPACIPFFIGVELVNSMKDGEEFSIANLTNVLWNTLEPITNLSMLSGIQGVIEATRYADSSQTLSAIASDAIISYAMQGVPSVLGAVSRTIDPTQRSWYIDKNSKWFDSTSQTVINNVKSKIPGLSYTQIPKIDAWGRVVSRGGTAERILENFVSPGYYSKMDYSETDEELKRLFVKTGENVFPKVAPKSFTVDEKTKQLTADEYVTYAKAKGEYSFDYIREFLQCDDYGELNDKQRATVITNLYEFANAKAKTTVSEYDIFAKGGKYQTAAKRERNGYSVVDYYVSNAKNK